MSCPTQAWVNENEALFILKGQPQTFYSPFRVQSDNLCNVLEFVVDSDPINPTSSIQFIYDNGLSGPAFAIDKDSFLFKFSTLTSSVVINQDYTEIKNVLYITDKNDPNTFFSFTPDPAGGGLIEYSNPTSSILFSSGGNILLNTYVAVDSNGLALTVLDATNRSTQITSHDILFSDTLQNPIGGMYANGTAISLGTSNFGSTPAITIDNANNVVVNSGNFSVQQTLSNYGGVEGLVAFVSGPGPNYYLLNSTVNNGPNGRFANQLNFWSPYESVAYNFFQLDVLGGNTNFTRGVRMYYDIGVGANSGQIAIVGGGTGGAGLAYGGRILTNETVNGLYISANNFGASTLADLYLFGSTIQLGTVGSPAVVTINGAPLIPVVPATNAALNGSAFYGISQFPNLPTTEPGLLQTIPISAGMLSATRFNLTFNMGTQNVGPDGGVVILSWYRNDSTNPSSTMTALSAFSWLQAGASVFSGAYMSGTYTFVLGTDYFATTTGVVVYVQKSAGYPNTRIDASSWNYNIS